MTTPRLYSALPALMLLGLVACGSQSGGLGGASAGASAGAQPASSGAPGAVGGSTSQSQAGASTVSSGGSDEVPSAGSPGSLPSGGTTSGGAGAPGADGGATGTAGSTSSGAGVSSAGGAGPGPGILSGIPTGYPAPTADNAAKCKTVPMAGGFCPGGGPGPVCMQCLFGSQVYGTSETTPTAEGLAMAGNYLVTLKLAGTSTFVSAESSRGMLAASPAGDYSFVVNVRAMEGQPKHAGGPSGYPGLDLFFSGPAAPLVTSIGYALATPAAKPIMVYIASDSTACDQTGNAFGGWGQMLPQYFAAPVGIANYANSGASSGGFAFWNDIKAHWTAGDYVIVQFGHNDKTQSDAEVQTNLEKYATDALAAKVIPIIVSPPARAQITGSTEGSQVSLHAAAAKAAAAAKGVAYIDLTALSTAWYNTLGSQAAALKFHANGSDPTHTNLPGADKIASLVVGDMRAQKLPLAQYLR